jgi:thiol-disulfide isomerase/thioredoxin
MIKYLTFVLVLPFLKLDGQTFVDCCNDYHTEFNKIQLQRTFKEVSDESADNAINWIGAILDSCIVGKEIPDYSLLGRSGETYTKESLKGKVVVFNFWSINCGPCIMEIPVLNRIHLSYRENKDFILISILLDKEEALKRFLQGGLTKRRIVYEVIPNSKAAIKSTFKLVKAYPTNLFIDREGKVFEKTIGGIIDPNDEQQLESKFKSIIDKELNKQAKGG